MSVPTKSANFPVRSLTGICPQAPDFLHDFEANDLFAAKADEIPGLFPVQREFAIINGGGPQRPPDERYGFCRRSDRAVDRDRCWLGF